MTYRIKTKIDLDERRNIVSKNVQALASRQWDSRLYKKIVNEASVNNNN